MGQYWGYNPFTNHWSYLPTGHPSMSKAHDTDSNWYNWSSHVNSRGVFQQPKSWFAFLSPLSFHEKKNKQNISFNLRWHMVQDATSSFAMPFFWNPPFSIITHPVEVEHLTTGRELQRWENVTSTRGTGNKKSTKIKFVAELIILKKNISWGLNLFSCFFTKDDVFKYINHPK